MKIHEHLSHTHTKRDLGEVFVDFTTNVVFIDDPEGLCPFGHSFCEIMIADGIPHTWSTHLIYGEDPMEARTVKKIHDLSHSHPYVTHRAVNLRGSQLLINPEACESGHSWCKAGRTDWVYRDYGIEATNRVSSDIIGKINRKTHYHRAQYYEVEKIFFDLVYVARGETLTACPAGHLNCQTGGPYEGEDIMQRLVNHLWDTDSSMEVG